MKLRKTFDFRRTPEETFLTGRRAGGDSAKTHEFSALRTRAEIRMSFRDALALIGRFMEVRRTIEITGRRCATDVISRWVALKLIPA